MAVRPVLTYPDECLKRIAAPVEVFDAALRAAVADLEETMRAGPAAVGIAAPQTGWTQRVVIIDASTRPQCRNHGRLVLVNPEIVAREGAVSFAALRSDADVAALFARDFADAVPLLGDPVAQYAAAPQGMLGTIYTDRWHVGGEVLLLGDAAHAIVPFHGQGMNCAFEDCVELAQLVDAGLGWEVAFAEFQRRRQPNADAIAQMALENYVEMRDTVRDRRFLRQKQLALRLEQRHPGRFIPRYSMVSFHPEIPYAEALRRGAVQQGILDELDAGGDSTEASEIDLARADALVLERLPELGPG